MAQVGVAQAHVDIDYGGAVKTVVTNSAGEYSYIAYMTEAEYNALPANFSIEAKKSGYVGATASIAKPDFASAVSSGIQMDAVVSPIDPTQFSISPEYQSISAAAQSATITVTAQTPDWTFEVLNSPSWVSAVRTNDSTITVTFTQFTGGSERVCLIMVYYNDAELDAEISQNGI